MIYPLTDILSPGPISNDRFENSARLGDDFEAMLESRDCSNEIPSPLDEAFEALVMGAGASGSASVAL